jgi:hypothetical protein
MSPYKTSSKILTPRKDPYARKDGVGFAILIKGASRLNKRHYSSINLVHVYGLVILVIDTNTEA